MIRLALGCIDIEEWLALREKIRQAKRGATRKVGRIFDATLRDAALFPHFFVARR